MGGKLAIGGTLRELVNGLLVRARRSRRSVGNGLRRILDDSASPSCCSIDRVAHVRRLIEPDRNGPDAAPKRS